MSQVEEHDQWQRLGRAVFSILKFFYPKFYNKVTWTVVLLGASLLGTSLIEKLLWVLLSWQLEIDVTSGDDPLYGSLLIVCGLIYNLVSQLIEQKHTAANRRIDEYELNHDAKIVNGFLSFLTFEELERITNDAALGGLHIDLADKVENFAQMLALPTSKLHNKELDEARQKLAHSANVFWNSMMQFLGYEPGYPADKLVPPFDMKRRDRDAYYGMQRNVANTGMAFREAYIKLVDDAKTHKVFGRLF